MGKIKVVELQKLDPVVHSVVDMLRHDSERWGVYVDGDGDPHTWVIKHYDSSVRIDFSTDFRVSVFIPGAGWFYDENGEVAKEVRELGILVRRLRALQYLKRYESHALPK